MSEDISEKTSMITGDTFSSKMKEIKDTPPTIVVLLGPPGYVGKQWVLSDAECVIGRSVECAIYIDDKSVSRTHARINITNS